MALRCGVCVDHKKYTRRIRIEQRDETNTNGLNEVIPAWTTFWSGRAWGEPVSGREYWQADQKQAINRYKYRVRYSKQTKQIRPKMRIVDVTDSDDVQVIQISAAMNIQNANQEIEIDGVREV